MTSFPIVPVAQALLARPTARAITLFLIAHMPKPQPAGGLGKTFWKPFIMAIAKQSGTHAKTGDPFGKNRNCSVPSEARDLLSAKWATWKRWVTERIDINSIY